MAALLDPRGDAELRRRVLRLASLIEDDSRKADHDIKFLRTLDEIRLGSVERLDGVDAAYIRAFREWAADPDTLPVEAVIARIQDGPRPRAVQVTVAAGLDHWARMRRGVAGLDHWARLRAGMLPRGDPERWKHLLAVARAIDPDPWRNRVRAVIERDDGLLRRLSLFLLARSAEVASQGPQGLVMLGAELRVVGQKDGAITLLEGAQRRFPDDFWINVELAHTYEFLDPPRRDEAIRYYTAARALRPETGALLGFALLQGDRVADGMAVLREAIRRQPGSLVAHLFLGLALIQSGDREAALPVLREASRLTVELPLWRSTVVQLFLSAGAAGEAEPILREGLRLAPDDPEYRVLLGDLLRQQEKWDEAIAAYRQVLRLNPRHAGAHIGLGQVYFRTEDLDRGIAELDEALKLHPDQAQTRAAQTMLQHARPMKQSRAWLQELREFEARMKQVEHAIRLSSENKPDEAIAILEPMAREHPDEVVIHQVLGTAFLQKHDMARALGAFREKCRLRPDDASLRVQLAKLYMHQGDTAHALEQAQAAVGLKTTAYDEFNLGHVFYDLGQIRDAMAAFEREQKRKTQQGDAKATKGATDWVGIARRWIELDERLPAILRGEGVPDAPGELRELAELCYRKRWCVASARFWAAAFAAAPRLAEETDHHHRYDAACSAALAGTGRGKDTPLPDGPPKEKLRQQARAWLRADLAAHAARLGMLDEKGKKEIARQLSHWKHDPDLAGVREPDALAKLPERERDDWRALWAEVDRRLEEAGKQL
jgi:tetratricopeptide (TPR) repeat protein